MAQDLSELLCKSSSTRQYFISLPVWLQTLLHNDYSNIRTAAQLHRIAETLSRQKIPL
nr:hypothetical protein [uncultured Eisenbergiella sp.]